MTSVPHQPRAWPHVTGLGGQEEWWCHCFTCYSSFRAAHARVLHFRLHSVSAPRHWISSLYTDAKPLQWRVARMLLFAAFFFFHIFFSFSLSFHSTCVCSAAENVNGDANVETSCSCRVAVTPVCSLCRIMTTDRPTARENPTSLVCWSAATTNCIKQYLYESDTKTKTNKQKKVSRSFL